MADLLPHVSIVVPVRNAVTTLPACLASIERQTLRTYEVLAIDDGSEDASAAVLRNAAQRDERIRVLQPGRVGLVAALNLGMSVARAPLLARMDADDVMHPDRLCAQWQYLKEHPEIALIACQVALFPQHVIRAGYREYIRWQNDCLTPEQIQTNIFVESPFAHPSVMLRRSVFEQLGGYTAGPFPEDYELWLRMHHAGYTMAKLPRVLLGWREGADRTSRRDPRYARAAFDHLRMCFVARDRRVRTARLIVFWGAGRLARQRARLLMEHGVQPHAWIEINPRQIGTVIAGAPVQPPHWLRQAPRPLVLILVTTHGARADILATLSTWGYRNGVDVLALG